MLIKISSKDNPKIRLLRAVRKGLSRDYIFVEGMKLSEEVIKSNLPIYGVFFSERFVKEDKGKKFLELAKNFLCVEVTDKLFGKIADTESPQGVIVLCRRLRENKQRLEQRLEDRSLVVLLNRISDPLNLGAILRVAKAVDVAGVILTKGSADAFSAKAVRSSAGACLQIPVWSGMSFQEAISWAKEKGLRTVCADIRAEKFYKQVDWTQPSLLVFGSEGQGLSEREVSLVEERIKIPMKNGVESLNIAVACGIILYHASGL